MILYREDFVMLKDFFHFINSSKDSPRLITPIYDVLLNSHVFIITCFGSSLMINLDIEDSNCGSLDKALIHVVNSSDRNIRFTADLVDNTNDKQQYKIQIPDCEKSGTYKIIVFYPTRLAEQIQQLKISARYFPQP